MMDPAVIGLGLAVAVQFGGLVWGAAALKSAVIALKVSVDKLADTAEHLESVVNALDKRVAILEDRQARES